MQMDAQSVTMRRIRLKLNGFLLFAMTKNKVASIKKFANRFHVVP